MRIVQLHFKNLNSLAGEWRIDFTHPAYLSSGIFAITGPTGSGKTTILDAICLALYGKTPRLKTISKSTNEIMTRNTGDCFAEVVFESQAGRYIVHWGQRRAYGKPDKELQPPRHEIREYPSGKILQSKLSTVLEKVIETTGLDYNQFTRSIMLAQGDFATFLNANADERAPILEKITGTEIYSEISIKVHERNVAEAGKQKELKEKIGNLDLLTPERELELRLKSQQMEEEVRKIGVERDSIRKVVSWVKDIGRLEEEIAKLDIRRKSAEEKRSLAAEDLVRLSRARKTLSLEELFSKTLKTREQAEFQKQEIKENNETLTATQVAYEKSHQHYEVTRKELDSLKENLEKEKEVIIIVRDLDVRIQESARQISEKKEDLKGLQVKILDYQTIIDKCEREVELKKQTIHSAVSYLTEHGADARLSESLSGLELSLRQYKKLIENLALNRSKLEEQKEALTLLDEAHLVQKNALIEQKKQFDNGEKELRQLQNDFEQLLDYRGPGFWRAMESSLKERKSKLESLVRVHESVERSDKKIQAFREKRRILNEKLRREQEILSEMKKEQELREEILAGIERNIELLNRVQNLEEERGHLEDGKACPLCGSRDHPYARGNVPASDPVRAEYAAEKDELEDLLVRVHLQENSISILETDIHLNEENAQSLEEGIRESLEESNMGFDDILYMTRSCGLKRIILKSLRLCDVYYSICRETCESIDKIEKPLDKKKTKVSSLKDSLAKVMASCKDAEFERKECAKSIHDLEDLLRTSENDRVELFNALLIDLKDFGIDSLSLQNIDENIQSLKQRKTDYESKLTLQRDAEKEIDRLSHEILGKRTLLIEDQKTCESLSKGIGEREKSLKELSDDRISRYGEKDPSVEEKKFADLVKSGEEAFQAVSDKKKGLETRIESLQEQISKTTIKLEEVRVTLGDLETSFREGIKRAGFPDEEDFVSARLPHDRFEILDQMEKELIIEEREVSSLLEEKNRILGQQRTFALTDRSLEDLNRQVLGCEEKIGDINRNLGSISQILKKHDELITLQKDLVQALEQQNLECLRWEKLHDLIGSSDGKKFRVFAQGLTFDRLIAHANHHLRKMSDRYILIRRENSVLDLDIMDNYQAGQVRSTKNLSGGESFIVSLALALGLSGMASRNVRIDSLFLDEGFGTLDNDTLEIALETLSNLQQEGKIIGIISHVPALKERISTQIVVEKTTLGRSRLRAPGCTSSGT